jgi:hypothetical protein
METPHNETVVEKAVAYVKEVFGIHPTPEVDAKPEFSDTAPEVTAENAMRLDPNAYESLVPPESGFDSAARKAETERLRREVDEHPPQKTAWELNAESARAEDGG